jgi:hypothetical protein
MGGFEFNEEGMEELRRELEQKLSLDVRIPLDGSEDEAIQSVKEQLRAKGATPDDSEIQQAVRNARGT